MDPTIFTIGNFPIRWYGTMYIVAFTVVYLLTTYRVRRERLAYDDDFISNVITWAVLGLLIGGRFGYVLFYNFDQLLSDPLGIISPFSRAGGKLRFTGIAGMSYHGGVLGIVVAWAWFARRNKISIFEISDLIIPAIPLGFTFGRLGNFINGELYGRVTDFALGMYFPAAADGRLRHPSQLYEALFEGLVLFAIVWPLRRKKVFTGFISGLYIFGYGFFRFFIEFFRQPDEHLGFVLGPFSMGQVLCLLMLLGAGLLWYLARRTARDAA
ncbi:MAG: prolipoprotein diacylglyceryl transferase [Candidatus Neomarinimicrobiota bacterium]